MPWCPKCKTEYREGFTTCADCNVELVEELETLGKTNDYEEVIALEEETTAKKLVEFLTYSQITAYFEYSKDNKAYSVYAPHADVKKAKRCFQAFYKVELENMEKSNEPDSYVLNEEPLQSLVDDAELESEDVNGLHENVNAAGIVEEDSEDTIDSIDEVNAAQALETEDTLETIKAIDIDDMEKPVDAVEFKDIIKTIDTVEIEDIVEPTDTIVPKESISYDDSINVTDVDNVIDNEDINSDEISENETPKKYDYKEGANDLTKITTPAYVKKSDQYKDLKSTAITFLVFGFAGLIFVALNVFGTISVINGTFGYIVMSLVFIGFIFVGINSVSRSKKAAADAILEEELTSSINTWLSENVSEEFIQEIQDDSLSAEVNFIRTMDRLKEMVTKALGEMDESYLEYVVEEYYNNHFDSVE